MRRRGPELTALLLAAHIVSLCLLFAEADALGSQGSAQQGQLTSNEVIQKLQDLQITMRKTDTAACRLPVVWKDELLTDCKAGTAISSVPWCFTEYNNKRRACTAELGAVRPFTWFLKDKQGTDGLAGSLCSLSGGDVAGYKLNPCKDNLVCAALANSSLAGTGVGFCNLTSGGQYERPVDMRPQYFLGHAQPQPTEQQSSAQKAAAKSVSNDNAGASMGAVSGLKDVVVSTRVTTTGASCKLPVVYKGSLETDCFDVNGQSSCFVGSLDTPSACQLLGNGDTNVTQPLQDMLADGSASDGSDGALCRLYDDAGASIGALNVTICAQGLACTPLQVQPLVGSGFGYCSSTSGNVTGAVDAALPPTAGGLASLSQYNVVPRTTVIGERCRLPVVYGDSLLLDCVPLSQGSKEPECFVEGLQVVDACAPANTTASSLSTLLDSGNAVDGADGSLCSLIPTSDKTLGGDCKGGLTCMPLTGPMSGAGLGFCTQTKQLKGQAAAKELYVAQRVTMSGKSCRLPLIYGGNLLLDCTLYNGTEVCFPEGGDMPEQCAPVQTPVTAALSQLMQDGQNMDGKRGSMCTDTDRFSGKKVGCQAPLACEAMIGPMLHSGYGYCTDLNIGKFGMTGAMRAAMVTQRRTTAGVPCRLPLVYNGQLQLDCTPAVTGNSTQCYVAGDNTMQTCDPTPAGDPVKLPILMASGQAGDGQRGSICALPRNASSPNDCSSPFWCKTADVPPMHGSGYGYCTDEAKPTNPAPGTAAMSSSGAQAATALAATSPLDGFEAAVRVARNNAPCRIPIVYRGSLELDCRDFNNSGVEQCFVSGSSEPQACKPASAAQQYPALTEALASGQALDGAEGSLCVLNSRGQLPPGAKSPFIPASAGGGGCNLGLTCLTLGGPLDGSGYGYCALTLDGQAAIKTGNVAGGLTGVRIAQRRTIDGNACRLPVVYQGELISNCRSLDGSSQQQCFVQGLNVVQDCADTRNYPTQLAPAMLAAGQGTDGQEGSLCAAVPSPADPTLNKLVPCNMGLACLPLQAGGSAGSGVGYCTKLGLGGSASSGAAALPVTLRKTTSGKNCRQPIVYKGQLITGCVSVAGVDKCFPGDFSGGAESCAPVPGGYNMTTFADLLSVGRGVDGLEGSLCDPKAKGDELSCGRNLACVPMSKGALANAKFGYCAGGEEAKAALGSAAIPSITQPQCGPACIAGAAIGGAILAALLVSAAWWFNVRRTRAKRKSVFQKFEEGEFADISAVYGEAAKPKRSKPAVSIAPTRAESLSNTSPVHKSALPVPQTPSPAAKPPRTAKPGVQPDTPAGARPGSSPARGQSGSYEPPQYRPSDGGSMPSSLLGSNLSALGSSGLSSLTDSSPFAQSLERKSSRTITDEGPSGSGDSTSSMRSHQGLVKRHAAQD